MKQIKKYGLPVLSLFFLTGCSEAIVNAGYNTLLGMGMAFCVLIIISLVISVFPMIGKIGSGKKEAEKKRMESIDKTVGQIAQNEAQQSAAVTVKDTQTDDQELIAVFAAAIAAYEADMATSVAPAYGLPADAYIDDFDPNRDYGTYRARRIRRIRQSAAWKKA